MLGCWRTTYFIEEANCKPSCLKEGSVSGSVSRNEYLVAGAGVQLLGY